MEVTRPFFHSHLSLGNQKVPTSSAAISVSFPDLISLPPFHIYTLAPLPSLPTSIPLFIYLHLCPNTPAGVLSHISSKLQTPTPVHICCTFTHSERKAETLIASLQKQASQCGVLLQKAARVAVALALLVSHCN